ncbi:Hypp1003 [Branchiostoma lanceolatum]|uniref:Hypp1003 protein n=1 Tax=Branchiostoma lanceolatum TaxID=7740 RepID=A0A8J9ZDU2_BRALA|nr:Hypp1003 [Branchiostoma lanceolatum]
MERKVTIFVAVFLLLGQVACSSTSVFERLAGGCDDVDCPSTATLENKNATLMQFWEKIKSAVDSTKRELGVREQEVSHVSHHLVAKIVRKLLADETVRKYIVESEMGRVNESVVAVLSSKISKLEFEMSHAMAENEELKSQVAEMRAEMTKELDTGSDDDDEEHAGNEHQYGGHHDGRHVGGKSGRLKSRVAGLESTLANLQWELVAERNKVGRYEEELASLAVRQEELQVRLEELTLQVSADSHSGKKAEPTEKLPHEFTEDYQYDYVDDYHAPLGQRR